MNQAITIEKYNLTGGSNTGGSVAHTLTLNDLLTWSGGTLKGSGTLNATGGANLSGGTKFLADSRVVNLGGTSTWSAGNFDFQTAPSLVNTMGGELTTNFDGSMNRNQFSGGGTFTNAGTFTKSGGTGTTNIGIAFNNSGTVNVNSGVLSLNSNGIHSGTLAVGAGGILSLAGGTHNLNAGTSFSGAGTIQLTGSTVTVNAAVASAASTAFSMSGGTISGAGTLTVNGPLTWSGGTMNGVGTLNATGGANLSGGTKFLGDNRVVNLGGISTWSAGNFDFQTAPSLVNTMGGELTTNFDGSMNRNQFSGGGSFTNAGTFTKSGGTGTTNIGVSFSNTGTVNVNTGTLATNNGASPYNQSGPDSFTILESGTVLATSSLNLNGGTLKGTGTVHGSVIAGGGVNTIDPGFSPGVLTVNGNVTLSSTSTLAMEIGGLGQGTDYDLLDVNGTLTLAGMLDLDLINGFEELVQFNDVFTLATANSPILGAFSNVASGSRIWTNTDVGFDVWYGAGSIFDPNSLVITGAPEPSRAVLLMVGVAGLVMRRRRGTTRLELRSV